MSSSAWSSTGRGCSSAAPGRAGAAAPARSVATLRERKKLRTRDALAADTPVTVQLEARDPSPGGVDSCWQAQLTSAIKDDASQLKARQ